MKTTATTTADFVKKYENTDKDKLQALLKDMTGTLGLRMRAKKAALIILTTK